MSDELRIENERLRKIAINFRVERNLLARQVEELKRELAEARREIREQDLDTQRMRALAIEGGPEGYSGDPYDTGTFRDPWRNAR